MTWTQAQQTAEAIWRKLKDEKSLQGALMIVSALCRQVRPKKGGKI